MPGATLPADQTDPGPQRFPAGVEFPTVLVDPEALVRRWLADWFPDAEVLTETAADLASKPWTIKVGGSITGRKLGIVNASVVLDTYSPKRIDARTNALLADHAMSFYLRGKRLVDAVGDEIAVASLVSNNGGPFHVPDVNTDLHHFAAKYALVLNSLA